VTRSLVVNEVIQPSRAPSPVAERWMNRILLVPVTGAFLQLFFTQRIPSMGWVFALLGAAGATRIWSARMKTRERPARLGNDGVELADGFVAVSRMLRLERKENVVRITLRSGAWLELRIDTDAELVLDALSRAIAAEHEERTDARRRCWLSSMQWITAFASIEAMRIAVSAVTSNAASRWPKTLGPRPRCASQRQSAWPTIRMTTCALVSPR
jgi:hypothetical protein